MKGWLGGGESLGEPAAVPTLRSTVEDVLDDIFPSHLYAREATILLSCVFWKVSLGGSSCCSPKGVLRARVF